MKVTCRAMPPSVALETTLLVHGVPVSNARALAADLDAAVRREGASPALVGVLRGKAIVGMTANELETFLAEAGPDGKGVLKANTANLGWAIHAGRSAATTASATIELAAAAGVCVFATGGVGGVHHRPSPADPLDVSADLLALTRWPVAVVASGVKAILDVESTREALESLGVPVIGFGTDSFPAFYLRESRAAVDARFDDAPSLAKFLRSELARTNRGVLVVNPVPRGAEIARPDWDRWLAQAQSRVSGAGGRDATPRLLAAIHEESQGATLRPNVALVKENARLAAAISAAM